MGCETAYSLTVEAAPSYGAPLSKDYLEQIFDMLYGFGVFENLEIIDSIITGFAYDKWYEHDEDMKDVSKKFKHALFELYGDGEESDDFWRNYYYRGAMQEGCGHISYLPLDFETLCASADETEEAENPPPLAAGDLSALMGVNLGDGHG